MLYKSGIEWYNRGWESLKTTVKASEISKKISVAIDSVESRVSESLGEEEVHLLLNMLNKIRTDIE